MKDNLIDTINILAQRTKKNYPIVARMMKDEKFARQICRKASAKRLWKDIAFARQHGYHIHKIKDGHYTWVKN